MKLSPEQKEQITKKLPDWAIKTNPMNSKMSVINPMAVIDRLNEVFGVGQWEFKTEYLGIFDAKMGSRDAFAGMCKGTLVVPANSIHLEQYGGSTNMDRGDAMKGSATDALTKIASYLGIGASIYKNMGNVSPEPVLSLTDACGKLSESTTVEQLETVFKTFTPELKKDNEVIAKAKEVKERILEAVK